VPETARVKRRAKTVPGATEAHAAPASSTTRNQPNSEPPRAAPELAARDPQARFAILATAGHIDHGKTALVRRLTGVDTDRLPEERARGISIDLGFASLRLPSGMLVGIVDVPGHERFIKNMLAGVGGIDLVLLVIAADEGIMPQTREHLDIVTLLGVTHGVVALTKRDLIDDEWYELVEQEVRAGLASTPLAGAPIVPVSSLTGVGVSELLAALTGAAQHIAPRALSAPVRLPVDRVFSVEGFGTVVTGTLWRGVLRVGDNVDLLPEGRQLRIRSLEVHGASVNEAHAGQRTAVALHGVTREKVARGDWIVAPGSLRASRFVDVRVRLLPDLAAPLKSGARVRVYLGASEVLGRVVFLERTEGGARLAPGGTALAQLRLESPLVADRGDLFVLRSYSPLATIGGGTVLDPTPTRHRGKDAELVRRLGVAETGTPRDRLLETLRSAGTTPMTIHALVHALSLDADDVRTMLEEGSARGEVHALGAGGGYVHAETTDRAARRVLEALREHQAAHRLRWGMAKGELKSRLAREMSPLLFDHVLAELAERGDVALREDRVRAGGAELALSAADERLRSALLATLAESPFAPPAAADLATRAAEVAHASTDAAREMLAHLAFTGEVVRVTTEFAFLARALDDIERRVREHFAMHPELAVGDLKEILGISRRHAVPILEWLDRRGITSRRGDTRVPGRALAEERRG
jgi:selenocysteine-specific elongation factor